VKANLESRIHTMQMENKIFDVVIPMEDVMEIKGGKKQIVQRKVFPGYLLVKMVYDNDSWYVVRNTPGVTGFVSTEDEHDKRPKPVPLEDKQVADILKQVEARPTGVKISLERGETVRITEGPFVDFIGAVSDVDEGKGKVRVLVSFFGRETPVELDFLQVERV
jgi:transcriptional antiterminator NusG